MQPIRIEFYKLGANELICAIDATTAPEVGEFISIKKITYSVERRTWAVDYSGEIGEKLRANIDLKAV